MSIGLLKAGDHVGISVKTAGTLLKTESDTEGVFHIIIDGLTDVSIEKTKKRDNRTPEAKKQ
jgi:hypothetical protein